jgi:hypothetical protein
MRISSTPDPFETSRDRIFTDLEQRANAIAQMIFIGYSGMAREIVTESPAAY